MKRFNESYFKHFSFVFPEMSEMQLKVFVLYGFFYSLETIADELNITEKTIYSHLNRIKEKQKLKSLLELRIMFSARMCGYLLIKADEILDR